MFVGENAGLSLSDLERQEMCKRFVPGVMSFCLAMCLTVSLGYAAEFKSGDAIEVKVGGNWFPAKLVSVMGGRCRIEYPDGKRAWALKDKMRAAGSKSQNNATQTSANVPDSPAESPVAIQVNQRQFTKGQVLEYQGTGRRWSKVEVLSISDELYLVAPEGSLDRDYMWKWVTAYSLRKEGEDYPGMLDDVRFEFEKGRDSIRKSRLKAVNALAKFQRKHGSDFSLLINTTENKIRVKELALQRRESKNEALATADITQAIEMIPRKINTPWQSLVDTGESFTPRSVLIRTKLTRSDEGNRWLGSLRGDKFMLVTGDQGRHAKKYVYLTNIRYGSLLKSFTFHPDTFPLAVSQDGNRVVARGNGNDRLDCSVLTFGTGRRPNPNICIHSKSPTMNVRLRMWWSN